MKLFSLGELAYGRFHDAAVGAAAVDSEAAGREKTIIVLVGAEGRDVYVLCSDACVFELPGVGLPEVDVPFAEGVAALVLRGGPMGYPLHGKCGVGKGFADLVADLEGIRADAGADGAFYVFGPCAERVVHGLQRETSDVRHGASPSRMGCSDGTRACVVQQQGDTVGRGDADADLWQGSDECVDAFQVAGLCGRGDLYDACAVYLTWQEEAVGGDAELLAQRFPAGRHVMDVIARIRGDVEAFIGSVDGCGVTLRGKGDEGGGG